MSEELFFLLSLPLIIAMASIAIKFVLLCQAAREEEFEARRKAVALAQNSGRNH